MQDIFLPIHLNEWKRVWARRKQNNFILMRMRQQFREFFENIPFSNMLIKKQNKTKPKQNNTIKYNTILIHVHDTGTYLLVVLRLQQPMVVVLLAETVHTHQGKLYIIFFT